VQDQTPSDHRQVLLLLGEGKSFRTNQERDQWAHTRLMSLGAKNLNLLISTPTAFIAEVELSTSAKKLDERSKELFDSEGFDFGLIPSSSYFAKKKLIAFDLDSTLIAAEGIDELARELGVFDQVSEITERAMDGNLNFESSFCERVQLLRGLTLSQIEHVVDRIAFSPGVEQLFQTLKKQSIQIAVLSGGFDFIAEKLKKTGVIDYLYTNRLEFKEGIATGVPLLPIIDGNAKKELLSRLMTDHGFLPEEVIAVGDGANDIGMIQLAGISVGFRAKPALQKHSDLLLRHRPLSDLSYLVN